jgi:hypothetical protein
MRGPKRIGEYLFAIGHFARGHFAKHGISVDAGVASVLASTARGFHLDSCFTTLG